MPVEAVPDHQPRRSRPGARATGRRASSSSCEQGQVRAEQPAQAAGAGQRAREVVHVARARRPPTARRPRPRSRRPARAAPTRRAWPGPRSSGQCPHAAVTGQPASFGPARGGYALRVPRDIDRPTPDAWDPSATRDTWWREGVLYQIYPRSFARLRRRRPRRPARHHRAARPPRVARRRRHLAEPDVPVAQRRLGLRRLRLPRRPSRLRNAGGHGPADRRGRASAASASCSTSSPTTRATSTRGSSTRERARRRAPRLVHVGRRRRRRAAEQLGERRSAGRPGRFHEPTGQWYLHNFLAEPARPQLVERRRRATRSRTSCASGSTAAWPASGSTSPTPWSRTASCATTRRDRRRPSAGAERGLRQVYSMNRPRGTTSCAVAAAVRREPAARCCVGETFVYDLGRLDAVLRRRQRRAAPRPSTSRSRWPARARRRCARSSETVEAGLPGEAWPTWTGSNHDVGRLATRWADGDEAAPAAG